MLELRRRRAREYRGHRELLPWLEEVTPTWEWRWPHLTHIQSYLDAITTGELSRLMLFVPPRHGKSEMSTVRYPVYRLERDPSLRVIVAAYNQTLANKFSRKSRRIARTRMALNAERNAVEDWETMAGGGMRVVGVGGGVTGQGGDLIVIDDPVKNRQEAESEAYRERVWEWYTDDLWTRLEPGAAMILIMTRWHEDDLAGRILASDDAPNWTVVSLPAEAEENDPLGREPGEALCRDRYDEEALASAKRVLGRSYYALYQQRPQPREGAMFSENWFEVVGAAPKEGRRVRWWDMGATEDGGDYTVGVLMRMTNDQAVYIEDVERFQLGPGKRDKRIRAVAEFDGPGVHQWSGQEPGAAGKSSAEAFVRLLSGFPAHTMPETGDKETRAEPLSSYADTERKEEGRVKLVRGEWNKAFVNELIAFPSGKHDDQVDAASHAFNVLARHKSIPATARLGFGDLAQANPWSIS